MGELRSALVAVAPEVVTVVDPWLERTSASKPSNGIPAHVTILFPFVPAAEMDDALVDDLRELFSGFQAFELEYRATGRFPGIVYLAPEPAGPFVSMTDAVAASYPAFPPYGGVFDTVIPHLTAAEGDAHTLARAEAEIRPWLPIASRVDEVVLLEEVEPSHWRPHAVMPLAPA